MSLDVLGLADRIAQIGNLNAITDAGTAGALSRAAVSAAGANVRINLTNMQDDPQAARMLNEVDEIESSTEAKYADLKSRLKERANIALL
jgi:formiminotetrahydrofolate cyclodeaminase